MRNAYNHRFGNPNPPQHPLLRPGPLIFCRAAKAMRYSISSGVYYCCHLVTRLTYTHAMRNSIISGVYTQCHLLRGISVDAPLDSPSPVRDQQLTCGTNDAFSVMRCWGSSFSSMLLHRDSRTWSHWSQEHTFTGRK